MIDSIHLTWGEQAPVEGSDLTVWTSLLPEEAGELRRVARGKRVLEIGAGFGFSTLVLASVAEHVWSIDPHNVIPRPGYYGFECDPAAVERYRAGTLATLERNLGRLGLSNRVSIRRALSTLLAPGKVLAEELEPVGIDIAFIDGDHSYDAVCDDLENCERILGEHGTILAHDYLEAGNPDVKQAVDDWLAGQTIRLVGTMAVIEL